MYSQNEAETVATHNNIATSHAALSPTEPPFNRFDSGAMTGSEMKTRFITGMHQNQRHVSNRDAVFILTVTSTVTSSVINLTIYIVYRYQPRTQPRTCTANQPTTRTTSTLRPKSSSTHQTIRRSQRSSCHWNTLMDLTTDSYHLTEYYHLSTAISS